MNDHDADEITVDLEFPRGVMWLDDEAALTLKSGRVVTLGGGLVTRHDDAPLTPDERREIAAEMVARWFRWSTQADGGSMDEQRTGVLIVTVDALSDHAVSLSVAFKVEGVTLTIPVNGLSTVRLPQGESLVLNGVTLPMALTSA